MGRPKGSFKVPSYRTRRVKTAHGTELRACAEFSGRTLYFPGLYGSEESRAAYERAKAEWFARGCGRVQESIVGGSSDITIEELCAAYLQYCKTYYRSSPSSYKRAKIHISLLVDLYGDTPARDFRPLKLMALAQHLIDAPRRWGEGKRTRNYVNDVSRGVKTIFRWAKTREYIAPSVYHALADVEGLAQGRTDAAERPPVRAVQDDLVEKTLPYLRPHYRAMVQIQRLTKARAGEICCMRARDIDMTSVAGVWLYRPMKHKGQWRGKDRVIAIGPEAQKILAPFLKTNLDAFIWDPAEIRRDYEDHRRARAKNRELYDRCPGHDPRKVQRRLRARKGTKARRFNAHVFTGTYQQALIVAADRADAEARKANPDAPPGRLVPRWTSHQLRHVDRETAARAAAATSRELAPLRAMLGHDDERMTARYVDPDLGTAIEVAMRIG